MTDAPLVVIVGETASGKSALATAIAERFNGELICADSWTVYRGFDIGTAKPSSMERALVPHHLLDVAEPVEGFSAAVFQRLAKQAITEILSRGKLPILVGGTGLYIDSILYDYSFLPKSDPEGRAVLNMKSLDELIQRVQELGLNTEGIDLRNKRRVIRLIENEGERPTKRSIRDNTLVLGMKVERETLGWRIAARVDAMLAAGLENEVEQLAGKYGWGAEAMKGIGYREWQPYFVGTQTLGATREKIIKSTMDLAKKQRTWFRRNNSIQWVSDRSNAVDLITTFLNKAY
jgi:tRNA dimethylallyltransferase